MNTFPHYLQLDAMDCGPTCLRMIAKYYGKNYSLQTLRLKPSVQLFMYFFILSFFMVLVP